MHRLGVATGQLPHGGHADPRHGQRRKGPCDHAQEDAEGEAPRRVEEHRVHEHKGVEDEENRGPQDTNHRALAQVGEGPRPEAQGDAQQETQD